MRYLAVLTLAVLSCMEVPLMPTAPVEEPRIAFCGRVVDIETNAPIEGAYVEAQVGYFGWIGSAYTDENGVYVIPGGSFEGYGYVVVASAPGYITQGVFGYNAGPPPIFTHFKLYPETKGH